MQPEKGEVEKIPIDSDWISFLKTQPHTFSMRCGAAVLRLGRVQCSKIAAVIVEEMLPYK